MAKLNRLTAETFLAVAEMIAAQLRIKEADRWSPHICQLKFHSFTSEFPEITEPQFMWVAEQWIQGTGPDTFKRYPTWRELMAPLYRTQNGMANRSWGFREEPAVLLSPCYMAAGEAAGYGSAAPCPSDPQNSEAYRPFKGNGQHSLHCHQRRRIACRQQRASRSACSGHRMKRAVKSDGTSLQVQGILERGLLTGKWSTLHFNKKGLDMVLPSPSLLAGQPQFQAVDFRDLAAFRKHCR